MLINKISIVFSCFNEEKCIDNIYNELKNNLDKKYYYDLIFVNDGSIDNTKQKIIDLKNKNENKNFNIILIDLSKNFGHENAMLAGLDYSNSDVVVFMDVDGQHPVMMINESINKIKEGYNIVSLVRTKNEDKNYIDSFFSTFFYKLINKLSNTDFIPNASDFFVIDNLVLEFLKNNYREKVRFLRGIVQNLGFNKTYLHYVARKRFAGNSHYNYKKLTQFAINTIISYTTMPLHLGVMFGIFSSFLGICLLIYTLITRDGAPSGYATIIIFLCFMFAVLFLLVGIIGEYLATIFVEIKNRPNYIIKQIIC